jgi:L-alanine-DL-glutamate epimerase-like enolase superfamily enzyme
MRIKRVVAHLLEEKVRPFTWQVDRPGSGDGLATDRMLTCMIRVVTDEGVEGHVVGGRGRVIMDLVERRIAKEVIGQDPLNTEWLWWRMWDTDRLEEFPLYALGLVDIALWDIKGKVAGLPVYKLIGGYRDSIPAQASTTSYDTEKEYLNVVEAAIKEGYTSVKLHLRYRDVRTNADVCKAVRKVVGDDYPLALDASAMWNYTDSLWFGRALEDLGYIWYEEPMREFDLGSYAKLCADLDIPVLAAECSDGAHWNAGEFVRRGACDILRTETLFKGGFTGGLKVAHLAESFGMNAEVHGGSLPNLHLCLAIPNNTYYEDIVIDADHVASKKEGPIPFFQGSVSLPEGTVGIGWDMDVVEIEKRALQTLSIPD